MKKLFTLLCVVLFVPSAFAQPGPWDDDLRICFSSDGTNFTPSTLFLDSADVPSIAVLDDGTLIAAFQWFPGTQNGFVATCTSSDNGATWSTPVQANFINQPSGLYIPVDPTIINVGGGEMRMYFSIGTSMITDSTLDVYSATSTDGINFTYDQSTAAYSDSIEIIEPAVGNVNGTWHCIYAIGAPWEGANHATSNDGLNFSPAAHLASDTSHSWMGNFMQDGATTKFYGSGDQIWWRSTTDGITWSPYTQTNVMGNAANPAVAKMQNGEYIMIYVQNDAPPVSSIHPNPILDIIIYPNPTNDMIQIDINGYQAKTIHLFNAIGELVMIAEPNTQQIDLTNYPKGIYFLQLTTAKGELITKKIFKQ